MKIPPLPLYQPGKQYPIADLPNAGGFTVIARHLSGQNFPAFIRKDDGGCHYLADHLGNRIGLASLTGWQVASAAK